ncbi:MAG: hypothetical protein JWN04_94 [Myxococcaceae bacterium]|nr:hypothetical protein [Myxococcaceae bacterium]
MPRAGSSTALQGDGRRWRLRSRRGRWSTIPNPGGSPKSDGRPSVYSARRGKRDGRPLVLAPAGREVNGRPSVLQWRARGSDGRPSNFGGLSVFGMVDHRIRGDEAPAGMVDHRVARGLAGCVRQEKSTCNSSPRDLADAYERPHGRARAAGVANRGNTCRPAPRASRGLKPAMATRGSRTGARHVRTLLGL